MAAHYMAADFIAKPRRAFQIDTVADFQAAEIGLRRSRPSNQKLTLLPSIRVMVGQQPLLATEAPVLQVSAISGAAQLCGTRSGEGWAMSVILPIPHIRCL